MGAAEVLKVAKEVTASYPTRAGYAPWPCILALIGGGLIIVAGILVALIGPVLATAGDLGFGKLIFGLMVLTFGLIVAWAAYGLRAEPSRYLAYGPAIVIVSMLTLVLAGGGFIIGSVLGIVGGIWAILQD
jgi:hypothetical protein